MIAWAVGWQEMAVLLSCFMSIPFIAGLTMFIVGLSIKKRGLWIAGLIVMLIPVLLMVLGAALVLFAEAGHA
jgi:magnesium-transporting ATPase (P-type)